jgi:hypothetical protein
MGFVFGYLGYGWVIHFLMRDIPKLTGFSSYFYLWRSGTSGLVTQVIVVGFVTVAVDMWYFDLKFNMFTTVLNVVFTTSLLGLQHRLIPSQIQVEFTEFKMPLIHKPLAGYYFYFHFKTFKF